MRPAEPQRRLPWGLAAVTALLLAARLLAPDPRGLVVWVPLEAAAQAAEQSGKPILYSFSAEWCAPCKSLDRDVFARANAAKLINERFVPVRVTDQQREQGKNPPGVQELQDRYRVSGFPTLVVARADGSPLSQRAGVRGGGAAVARFLEQALREAAETAPPAR